MGEHGLAAVAAVAAVAALAEIWIINLMNVLPLAGSHVATRAALATRTGKTATRLQPGHIQHMCEKRVLNLTKVVTPHVPWAALGAAGRLVWHPTRLLRQACNS